MARGVDGNGVGVRPGNCRPGGGEGERRPTVTGMVQMLTLALTLVVTAEPGRADDPVGQASRAWASLGIGGGGAMFTPSISPAAPGQILLGCDMSGAYRSEDGGKSWELIHYRELTGSTSVRPAWHPTDPTLVYAVNGWRGTLKASRDRGRTWADLPGSPPQQVTAIAFDPGNPSLMLVGSRGRISRSDDCGKTWAQVHAVDTGTSGPREAGVIGIHVDQTSPVGKRVCLAATAEHIFMSEDDGKSWSDLGPGFPAGRLLAFSGGSNAKVGLCVLYASIQSREEGGKITGGIHRSDDRGKSWLRVMGRGIDERARSWSGGAGQPAQYEFVLTTDVDPGRVYATLNSRGEVFRSDDRGGTWRSILHRSSMQSPDFNVGPNYLNDERGGGGDNISGFGIDPANPDHMVVADWMNCLISEDGGKSWDVAHTRSAEAPGKLGKGMRWLNTGLVVTTVWHHYIDPFQPDRRYIAYTDIGFARSTDAGKTWYWQQGKPLRNTTYELAFDPETPGKIWGAFADLHDIPNANVITGRHYFSRAGGGVGLSEDFAATWRDTSKGLPRKPVTSIVVDPTSPKGRRTLYASLFEDGVYRSGDDGKTWARASEGLGAPGVNQRACRLILHRDGTLFCLVTGLRKDRRFLPEGPGLYRSRDGGKQWDRINRSIPLLWPKDYDVDPGDSRIIYLGASDAGGHREGGLYKTSDGGKTWTRVARKGGDCFGATVHPRRSGWVYLCIAEGDDGPGLWLSKDAGTTWKPLEGLPFRNAQRIGFDPRDDAVIYVATFGASVWRGPAE